MSSETSDILVEEVVYKEGHSVVKPVSMNQKDLLHKSELGEGEVRSSDGCPALLAHDAQADVSLLQGVTRAPQSG